MDVWHIGMDFLVAIYCHVMFGTTLLYIDIDKQLSAVFCGDSEVISPAGEVLSIPTEGDQLVAIT